jgi:hypothetical protein
MSAGQGMDYRYVRDRDFDERRNYLSRWRETTGNEGKVISYRVSGIRQVDL